MAVRRPRLPSAPCWCPCAASHTVAASCTPARVCTRLSLVLGVPSSAPVSAAAPPQRLQCCKRFCISLFKLSSAVLNQSPPAAPAALAARPQPPSCPCPAAGCPEARGASGAPWWGARQGGRRAGCGPTQARAPAGAEWHGMGERSRWKRPFDFPILLRCSRHRRYGCDALRSPVALRSFPPGSGEYPPVARCRGHSPAAESLRRAALPGDAPRPPGDQRRAVGRGLARHCRERCRGPRGHWHPAPGPWRDGADAPVPCHCLPPRLSLPRPRHHADASSIPFCPSSSPRPILPSWSSATPCWHSSTPAWRGHSRAPGRWSWSPASRASARPPWWRRL